MCLTFVLADPEGVKGLCTRSTEWPSCSVEGNGFQEKLTFKLLRNRAVCLSLFQWILPCGSLMTTFLGANASLFDCHLEGERLLPNSSTKSENSLLDPD